MKLAAIHREAVQEGSRSVSGAQPPVRVKICDCTLKRVPESRFLSSLQDESSSCSVTGGAPVGDRRLISDILSGSIALSAASNTRAHDFALNYILGPVAHEVRLAAKVLSGRKDLL